MIRSDWYRRWPDWSSALARGCVRLAVATPVRIADPATRALMARLELSVDPELDVAFPRRRAASVTITTRDGRTETFLQRTRNGDLDLDAKFTELAAPVLGDARARSPAALVDARHTARACVAARLSASTKPTSATRT